MNDLFARTGRVLEVLLQQSTLNGDVKAEGLRLAAELQSAETDFATMIEDRVRAAVEGFEGRVAAVEDDAKRTRTTLFDTSTITALDAALEHRPEAREKLAKIFGGEQETEAAPSPPAEPAAEGAVHDGTPVEAFNGAPPEAFDHDGVGGPGGSVAKPPTDDVDGMTVAQLKKELDDREVGYPADAKKADLQDLLKTALGVDKIDAAEGTGEETASGA